jgi:hypothetical protein
LLSKQQFPSIPSLSASHPWLVGIILYNCG